MDSNGLSDDKSISSESDDDGSNSRSDNINGITQEDKSTNASSINDDTNSAGSRRIQRKSNSTRSKSSVFSALRLFKRAKSTLKNSISVNTGLSVRENESPVEQSKRRRSSSSKLKNAKQHDLGNEIDPEQGTTTNKNSTTSSSGSSKQVNLVGRAPISFSNDLKLPIICFIRSLEGNLLREVLVHRYETGQYIMDNLRIAFDINDIKYYGLKIVPNSIEHNVSTQIPWLKLNKSIYKQVVHQNKATPSVKSLNNALADDNVNNINNIGNINGNYSSIQVSVDLHLHIRYYPSNTATLQDQFLKQYLWLQLKRDLRIGKLTSTFKNLSYLMACVIQYDCGDYEPELVDQVKQSHRKMVPHQNSGLISSAIDVWRDQLNGCKQHQTQMRFLRAAVLMETYGFDFHPVRDHQRRRPYLLGFNYTGVKTIRHGRVEHNFWWYNISKISYERQMLILHIDHTSGRRKQILGFECLTNKDCRNLCSLLLDHKDFFTSESTQSHATTRRPSQLFTCNEYSTVDLLNSDLMALDAGGLRYDEDEDNDEDENEDEGMSDDELRRSSRTSSPQSADGKLDLDDNDNDDEPADDGDENQSPDRTFSPESMDSANSGFIDHQRFYRKQQGDRNGINRHIGNLADEDGFEDRILPGKTTRMRNVCDICKLTTSAAHRSIPIGSLSTATTEPSPEGAVEPLHHHQEVRCTKRLPESNKFSQTGAPVGSQSDATTAQQRRRATTILEETTTGDNDSFLGQKLINLLERSLIQPVIECLASNDDDTASGGATSRCTAHSNQYPLTISIIVLCMLILFTNMMLSIVNTLSSSLIELLSVGKQNELQQQQPPA